MSNTSIAHTHEAPPLATLQPIEGGAPLSAVQLRSRLAVIQAVMRDVMVDSVDYGVIQGTDKPTLYKPGAEKLCVTFRLAPDNPVIEAVPELAGDIRYRVRVPVRAANGAIVAVGVGECSTGEEKSRWRRPVHENGSKAAPEDMRREKWTRKGEVWQQVRVTPADVANTVLKMAHKRAYVHAVIMATAAGSIFTQDIEDLPEGAAQSEDGEATTSTRPAPQPPQRRQEPARSPGAAPSTAGLSVISEAQAKRLFAIAMQSGWTADELARWLKSEYGLDSDRAVPRKLYDQVVKQVQEAAGA